MSDTAAFSFTPKINGDLFTIRGNTWAEFATNVDTVLDNAQLVAEKLTALSALASAAPLVNTPPTPPPAPPSPRRFRRPRSSDCPTPFHGSKARSSPTPSVPRSTR